MLRQFFEEKCAEEMASIPYIRGQVELNPPALYLTMYTYVGCSMDIVALVIPENKINEGVT